MIAGSIYVSVFFMVDLFIYVSMLLISFQGSYCGLVGCMLSSMFASTIVLVVYRGGRSTLKEV